MPESSGYKCDKCGAKVGEEDAKCPQCGEPFDEVVEKKAPACQYCGADIKEGDYICRKCGRPLKELAGPSLSGIGLMALGGVIYLGAFLYTAFGPSAGTTVEELSSQLKEAKLTSMVEAVGMIIFMFGSFLQCLNLFIAVKSQQPKK